MESFSTLKGAGRTISETDRIVAENISRLRTAVGFSQEKVAEHLGVTFQQVQKYERGINRLPVHMLHRLKLLYGIPYENFFSKCEETPKNSSPLSLFNEKHDALTIRIMRQIAAIEDKTVKRKIGRIITIMTL